MGYLRPTAMIVSGSYGNWPEKARTKAEEIFTEHDLLGVVSELVDAPANGEQSFLIAWDGSKEGWHTSDNGDHARDAFVAWLREQEYGDGSSPLWWVEVQYGGDDQEAIVLRHGHDRLREPAA